MPTLTDYLTQLSKAPEYAAATKPYVLDEINEIVASGNPTSDRLSLYLAQLRICVTHGFPRFIASLIARIPFDCNDPINGLRETDNQAILAALIVRLGLFLELTDIFDKLDAFFPMGEWAVRDQTKSLMADMIVIAQDEDALKCGLVFLSAAETIVLDTWVNALAKILDLPAFAKLPSDSQIELDNLVVLLNNWMSLATQQLLVTTDLGTLIDRFGITHGTRRWERAVMYWKLAMKLKIGLWPAANEVEKEKKPVHSVTAPPKKAPAAKGPAAVVASKGAVANSGTVGNKEAAGDSKSAQGDNDESPADDKDVPASKTAPNPVTKALAVRGPQA